MNAVTVAPRAIRGGVVSVVRTASRLLACCGALAISACNDSVAVAPPAVAAKLSILSGSNQTGRVASLAYAPLSVEVRDTRGLPMAGAEVTFTSNHSGSFSSQSALSDSDGVATNQFTYGTLEGDYTILATLPGVADTVRFSLHANPGDPIALQSLVGAAQSGDAGTALAAPLVVELVDLFGNPISGVTVSWTAAGGGTLSASTSVTDENGKAQVTLTLGANPGTETVTAHVENVPDTVFLETAK